MRTYHAIDVAKRFLELAQAENMSVSNMKLQKLVFFSQVVSLQAFKQPIHGQNSLAWDFGPVVQELYDIVHRFVTDTRKQFSLNDADFAAAFSGAQTIDDPDVLNVINAVWNKFKGWTALQLSNLTHRPGSPWAHVYNENQYGVIPHALIIEKGFGHDWPENF